MLSYEEQSEIIEQVKRESEGAERRRREAWLEECKKNGILPPDPKTQPKKRCDSPYTIEDGTATVLWVVVMVVGAIFKANWIIWIVATALWLKFISRYK